MKLKHAGAALGLVLMWASPASAVTCPFVNDPAWMAQHAATQSGLIGLVQGLQMALSGAMTLSNQMLVSASAVYTKQVDADAQRLTTGKVQNNQALAATMMQADRNLRIAKVQEDFGINTGQGVKACQTISLFNGVNSTLEDHLSTAQQGLAALDIAPGAAVDLSKAVQNRMNNLDKTDASVLFDPKSPADSKHRVIEQMAGLPLPKPGPGVAGAVAEGMMARARRLEALRSPALASLEAVAGLHSKHSHGGTSWPVGLQGEYGADASPVEALDALIAQYGGGTGYDEWSAGLAGQSERGLLIEYTRLRAMALKLRGVEAEQKARMTAVTAADLALQTGGL